MEEKTVQPKVNPTVSPQPTSSFTPTPRVDHTPVTEQIQQVKPPEDRPVAGDMTIPTDPYYTDPLFYEVVNYFNIPQEDYGVAKYKVSDIVDYVIREIGTNEPDKVLNGIRDLEEKVQPPAWGEHRYTNIYRYVRLASKGQAIKNALSAFEKQNKGEIT